MEHTYMSWLWRQLGDTCVKNLKKHGFDAHLVPTIAEARSTILDMVSGYESFGFAGSDTTRRLGVLEALRKKGKRFMTTG